MISALQVLSVMSKGRVEEMHGLLLEAVRHRLKNFDDLEAEVTVEDIKAVEIQLQHTKASTYADQINLVLQTPRRGKRRAGDDNKWLNMSGPQTRARKRARFLSEYGRRTPSAWDQIAVSTSDTGFEDEVIPESSQVSPTPSPSPVRVRDEDRLQPISSSPSLFASHAVHEQALIRIIKLRAEEAKHRHFTEEYLAMVAQHPRRAFLLRAKVEEMEA